MSDRMPALSEPERDRSRHPAAALGVPLLEVENLQVEFRTRDGVVRVVDDVSYRVSIAETLAVLGESGSGKSVTAQAIMGILDPARSSITRGDIRFNGESLLAMREKERRKIRGNRLAMIFQDSLSALNPAFRIGWQLGEPFRIHLGMSRSDAKGKAVELLDRVGIPRAKARVNDYPHQFSGGMRQRVMIAMALALEPDVLIADEPTTALDVTIQAQIMDLLAELQRDMHMALILITHDLGVVAGVADRVAVMYAGRVVEEAPVKELYVRQAHPYTRGLLESVPRIDTAGRELKVIPGAPPTPGAIPSGCPFHVRCTVRADVCAELLPDLREFESCRRSACHFASEVLNGAR